MATTTFVTNNQQQQQQPQQCELPQFTLDEYQSESSYFNEYDQEMAEAVNEAEYQDYYQEEQEQDPEEDIMDDSLLRLIVDVQSYLAEAPNDSPLFALQYKMYTYLKQRAFEMGVQVPPSL